MEEKGGAEVRSAVVSISSSRGRTPRVKSEGRTSSDGGAIGAEGVWAAERASGIRVSMRKSTAELKKVHPPRRLARGFEPHRAGRSAASRALRVEGTKCGFVSELMRATRWTTAAERRVPAAVFDRPSPINSGLRLLLERAPPTSELYGCGRVATSRRLLPRYTTSCTSSTDIAPWRDRYRQAAALGFDGLLRHLRRTRAKAVARWI